MSTPNTPSAAFPALSCRRGIAPAGPLEATRATRVASVEARFADELYRQYGPVVYRRCLKLLRDPEAAKDATQEVFIKLLRNWDKREEPAKTLPWVYRIATYHCLNAIRNARARREDAMTVEAESKGEHGREGHAELQLVRAVLSRFDARTQAVAVGVFVNGMEHQEIASALRISRRTVARKLERFVLNARKYVARNNSWDESEAPAAPC